MEEPQFFEWFSTAFVQEVQNKRRTRGTPNQTALLMYDGHSSHINCRIVNAALDNNIQVYKFPSHLTDKIQPLDKCVFGPVKTAWTKKLITFTKKQIGKSNIRLSKSQFVELLGEVWRDSTKHDNIVKGFISTGTFPVDSTKFPEADFNPVLLRRYKENQLKSKNSSTPCTSPTQFTENIEEQTPRQSPIENLKILSVNNQANTTLENNTLDINLEKNVSKISGPELAIPSISTHKTLIKTPSKIIYIFCQALNTSYDKLEVVKRRINPVPRLKSVKYGEILTNEKVVEKMKFIEAQRREKEVKKNKNKENKDLKKKQKKTGKKKNPIETDSDNEDLDENNTNNYSSDDSDFLESCIKENSKEVDYEQPE
ncbi:uncharacterized protein LOC126741242 [Anthonomus grandis grandis]|uniref:uncharacterized protein LOC126741242 n=1 Tax=Anthonomus grandis grandis TaxID=2921223 RepID=UPI002165F898|nr:uncharacterized protein LOC126741242 [Anthonomus grandis grandis]